MIVLTQIFSPSVRLFMLLFVKKNICIVIEL